MNVSLEDNELMQRVREKDPKALEQLYDRYERIVYSFAFRIVSDEMAAEEVMQELFLRIWNHAERYNASQGKLTTWIFAITRNIAVDMLRRKTVRWQDTPVEKEALQGVADDSMDTELHVERRMERAEVKEALTELSDDQKSIIDWIYYQGLTQQEVAQRYNIPLGTVKSRVRLAMNQLKRRLSDKGRRERIHE